MKLTKSRWLTDHGFGVHSPWAYDLIENVINERNPYYAYDDLYSFWEKAPDYLLQYPENRDQLLFRLVNFTGAKNIVEMGTAAGVSTGYLASVSSQSHVWTIDQKHAANGPVRKNLSRLPNITYLTGNPLDKLKELIEGMDAPIDFLHVAHTADFRQTVQMALPHMNPNGIIVIEDIHLKARKEFWASIIEDPRVGNTFHKKSIGLLFFDMTKPKQHYLLGAMKEQNKI